MAYSVTIGGVAKDIQPGWTISETANGRGRLSCAVLSLDASYRPAMGAEVILLDGATTIFGGYIDAPGESGFGGVGGTAIVTRISAVDYNSLTDRRYVSETIAAGTLKAALQVLDNYLTPYGVTLDAGQVNGPALPELGYDYRSLTEVLNELSVLSGYVWEIDYSKTLRMVLPSSTAAPFAIVNSDGNVLGDITVEPSRGDYANRIVVLGWTGQREVTDTFTADGIEDTWVLTYTLAASRGYVSNGATNETLGTGATWDYSAATNSITRTSPPAAPNVISITYTAQFPLRLQSPLAAAEPSAEQTAQGLWEKVIAEPDVFDATVLQALADAYLAQATAAPKIVRYVTEQTGLHPGQVQSITVAARNLSGNFILTDVTIAHRVGLSVRRTVTAAGGTSLPNRWQDDARLMFSGGASTSSASGGVAIVSSGGVGGTGTPGKLSKWATSTVLGDSAFTESGGVFTSGGTGAGFTVALTTSTISGNLPWGNLPSGSGTWTGTPTISGVATFTTHANPLTNYTSNLGSLDKKYLTLHAAELWVETLVAQDVMATIGGRVVVAPTTLLTADITAAQTSMYLKHNSLAVGDRVRMESAGKVEWMAITSGPIGGGPYYYEMTRNLDGSGGNGWYAGDAVLNTGTTGDGFIDLYSVAGVLAGAGPTIVGNVRTGTTFSNIEPRWAIGNLNGLYGYAADTYGAAFGSPSAAWIKVDPTNGIRIGHNATTKISLTAAGDASFSGSITAASGTIGGWTIDAGNLYSGSGATTVGMTSAAASSHAFFAGDGDPALAPFMVTKAGALKATNATITGAITATSGSFTGSVTAASGTIGGFTVGADYIRDAADSFGLASTVTAGDDVRFWAGATFANRATAPLRITEAGALTATSATITGTITGSVISGSEITAGTTNKIWINDGGDGEINVGGSTKASAPFKVNADGDTVISALQVDNLNVQTTTNLAFLAGSGNRTVMVDNNGYLYAV